MSEQTQKIHNGREGVQYSNNVGTSGDEGLVPQTEVSPNNFKKLHSTENKASYRYHPYEQPATVTADRKRTKWAYNPFAAYDDSSSEDEKEIQNPITLFMNDTPETEKKLTKEVAEHDKEDQTSKQVEPAKVEEVETNSGSNSDFFNLKNSRKAALLSLIQGYREEDTGDYDESNESDGATHKEIEYTEAASAQPAATNQQHYASNTNLPGYMLKLPESKPLEWNPVNRGFVKRNSSLSTYRCWKCNRVGHFAEDCTMFINVPAQSTTDPNQIEVPQHYESVDRFGKAQIYSPMLRKMYKRCKKLAQSTTMSCVACGERTHLVYCLDCDSAFCDGSGHIAHHLKQFPGHNQIYSAKIQRQVKCSKATCEEMSVYELWACQDCLINLFQRHCTMATGLWSDKGLKYLANTVSCEEHFEWHRVNCRNAMVDSEHVVERDKLESGGYGRTLNEYLF